MAATQGSSRARVPAAAEETLDLPALCALPSCRTEYRRIVGPGRPQLYCSDVCRRRAEKEARQLRSRLSHFESLVAQARIDLAAYGRADGSIDLPDHSSLEEAKLALARASGALRFLPNRDDAAADELRRLYEAVAPVIDVTPVGEARST